MEIPKVLIGVGGLSIAIAVLALWSQPAPPEDTASVHEGRTSIALASTPLVIRDGQLAVADVVRIVFEPQSIVLPEDAEAPLQELLDRIADGCILSAQVVGAASEFETAPRPVIDAHLLAVQRADAIAGLVRDSGVPATVVSSLWKIDDGQRVPDSIIWVFSSSSGSACVEPMSPFEL